MPVVYIYNIVQYDGARVIITIGYNDCNNYDGGHAIVSKCYNNIVIVNTLHFV